MIEHLSYSSISMYQTCPASWRFRYIDQVKTSTAPALVYGTAVHGAVEGLIRNHHQGAILEHWDKGWSEAMARQDAVEWDQPQESYYNQGLHLVNSLLPELNKITALWDDSGAWIEREFQLRVPGVPVPIVGYIDIVTEDGVPGDFKTSSKSWTQDKAEAETQPLFYLAAMLQLGRPVPEGAFRHYVMVKNKTPKFQVFEHRHSMGAVMSELARVRQVWNAIDKGVFPTNYTCWKCSPRWCEYWALCRGRNT